MEHVLNCTGYDMITEDIVRADGYYLFDSQGRKYIDFESGVWSMSLGHSNKELNEMIKSQIDKTMHLGFRYSSQLVEAAANDVIDTLWPFSGKCVFLCSGSEAVELAVKAAKHIIKDKMLLTFDLSYLSAYGQSSSKDDKVWYKLDLNTCSKCSNKTSCSTCKIFNEIPFERIGAFVLEPGNSSGLVLLPPQSLIREINKRIKADKGLIVVDEVTTGIGRTGRWYGYQHYDIEPDIVAMGKGIGNGYPVSVVAFADKVSEQIKDGFKHSQSHQNDALGCTVVSKVIKIIKDNDLINKSNELGSYMLQGLQALKCRTEAIKEARGIGMMIGLEFSSAFGDTLKEVWDYLLERGILAGYIPRFNLLRFYPALTTCREDIDYLIKCLESAILGEL